MAFRIEKALLQPVTRTSTGKLPPTRANAESTTPNRPNAIVRTVSTASPLANSKQVVVGSKASAEEIKEKMEQELRLQRAEHHKKRTLEMMQQKKGKTFNSLYRSICSKQIENAQCFYLQASTSNDDLINVNKTIQGIIRTFL